MKSKRFKHFKILLALLLLAAVAGGNGAWAQTFDITATHNSSTHRTTFKIKRSGDYLPAQTVNYRTVSLSAFAPAHFIPVCDHVTFGEGDTLREVVVREETSASGPFAFQQSTTRSYRFEVLDINGFLLAYKDRSFTIGTSVPTSGIFDEKTVTIQSSAYVVTDDGYQNNGYKSVSSSNYFNNAAPKGYFQAIGAQLRMTLSFDAKEDDDGYQYVQILFDNTNSCDNRPNGLFDDGKPGTPDLSCYTAGFEHVPSTVCTTYAAYSFPVTSRPNNCSAVSNVWDNGVTNKLHTQKFKSNFRASDGRLIVPTDFQTLVVRLNASGGSNDDWYAKNVKAHIQAVDATKPTLYGGTTEHITVSPGPYIVGNTFYISVPFSEIVHISGAFKKLNTTWGTVTYESGDYTNVITYKGTINASAGTTLAITGIENSLFNDLANNYYQGGNSGFNKTFIGVTCSATYTLDNYNTEFIGLASEYVLSGNGPFEPVPTTVYFYKGTKTTDHRTTLTPTTHYTLSWANNNTAGNGTITATGVAPYTGSASATFPIRWSTYTVRFHQNDGPYGTHATEDQTFTYATAQHLSSTLTRTGYTVARWTTEPDGSGTSYGATQEILNLTAEDGAVVDLYAQWAVIPWTGTGTSADDPYIILYASQLDSLAATVNSGTTYQYKFFQLGADITYPHTTNWNDSTSTENNYTAIGISGHEFDGTFDGDGHTVSGIRIYRPSNQFQGLFGRVYDATVKNVILTDIRITGNDYVGGIVGYFGNDTVQNCLVLNATITGNYEGEYHSTGAVVGYKYNGTLIHNYYRNCIVNVEDNTYVTNIGLGAPQNDYAGEVASLHTLGLPSDVTTSGETKMIDNVTYYASNTPVALTYTGAPGYSVSYSYNDGNDHAISGHTFTMPAADATVSHSLTSHWGIASGRDGTSEATAYLIADTADLNLLARYVNGTDGFAANNFSGKYFKLANNITYSHEGLGTTESNYTAIGGYFDGWKYFSGTFDGDNDTISGIRIYRGGTTNADGYQGLFGQVWGGTIKNVTLTDAVITGMQYVGGIAGYIVNNSGVIDNCHVTGSVSLHAVVDHASYHGGIVGKVNGGSVSGCTSAATLSVATGLTNCQYYGGIAGNLSGEMQNCLVIGATVSGTSRVGAIAGHRDNTYICTANYYRGCTVNGSANATGVGLGGEPGNYSPHDIDGIRSLHTLTLDDGITATGATETKVIGETTYYASASTVTLSYTGTPAVGYTFDGISVDAGTLSGSALTFDPAADVTVSATFIDHWGIADSADGSAGHPYVITTTAGLDLLATLVNGGNNFDGTFFKLGADITYSHTTAWNDTTSTENNYTAIGGYFDGWKYFSGTFDGCGHTVSGIRIYKGGSTYADDCQGLFGETYDATIKNITLSDVRITGKQNVGGISGYICKEGSTGGIVENCHVTSSVTLHAVADYARWHGGIAGDVIGGTVSGCSSAATLSYADGLTNCSCYGGIAGDPNGSLQNCLVLGATVNGTSDVGAVVGNNSGSVTDCHHRRCTVNGSAHNDLYAVVAGTDITLAPAGDATATYPYGGLQLYGSAILYGDTLYALQDSTVGLTLAYTGSSAHCFGFEATYGNDSYDILATSNNATPPSYLLTLPGSDVVVEALTCEHNYPVTVTAGSGTKMYDGTPLTKTAHEDFTVEGLPAGLTWTATADGTVTYVAPSPIGDEDKAENAVTDFHIFQNNVDVTSCFSSNNNIILVDGTLEVTKRPVTIKARSAYKPYDGTPLTCDDYIATGLAEADDAAITAAGRQTAIGTSSNVVTKVFIMNQNDGVLSTSSYEITKVDGTLTVTPRVDINAGSWHAVSTPMHDDGQPYWTFGDALTTNPSAGGFAYDLFRYDEPTATWENEKGGTFDHMEPARGYLYRSSDDFAIPYDGQFNNNPSYSIDLTATGAGDLRGFNLVGNPYPYRVKLDRAFYALNPDGSWTLHPNGDSIAAGQGALVYTTAPETLTFYAATRSTNAGAKGSLPALPSGLCLNENDNDNLNVNGDFARWDGDQIVVSGTGTLTAYDVMGRELFRREMKNEVLRMKNSDFPGTGVYILRHNGQSQKIVIR